MTNLISKKITVIISTTCNSTSVSIDVPVLESGYYNVKARFDSIGESNPMMLTINMNLNNATPSQLSVNGGRVTINGVGLP